MSKRIVTRARLHDIQIVVPGIGSLEKEIPFKAKPVPMSILEGEKGLELIITNVPGVVIIPYANVQVYFVAPEPTPTVESPTFKDALTKAKK